MLSNFYSSIAEEVDPRVKNEAKHTIADARGNVDYDYPDHRSSYIEGYATAHTEHVFGYFSKLCKNTVVSSALGGKGQLRICCLGGPGIEVVGILKALAKCKNLRLHGTVSDVEVFDTFRGWEETCDKIMDGLKTGKVKGVAPNAGFKHKFLRVDNCLSDVNEAIVAHADIVCFGSLVSLQHYDDQSHFSLQAFASLLKEKSIIFCINAFRDEIPHEVVDTFLQAGLQVVPGSVDKKYAMAWIKTSSPLALSISHREIKKRERTSPIENTNWWNSDFATSPVIHSSTFRPRNSMPSASSSYANTSLKSTSTNPIYSGLSDTTMVGNCNVYTPTYSSILTKPSTSDGLASRDNGKTVSVVPPQTNSQNVVGNDVKSVEIQKDLASLLIHLPTSYTSSSCVKYINDDGDIVDLEVVLDSCSSNEDADDSYYNYDSSDTNYSSSSDDDCDDSEDDCDYLDEFDLDFYDLYWIKKFRK